MSDPVVRFINTCSCPSWKVPEVSKEDALFHYSSVFSSKEKAEKDLSWAKKQIQLHEMTIEQDKDRFVELEGEVCGLRHDLEKAEKDLEQLRGELRIYKGMHSPGRKSRTGPNPL